MVGEKGNRQIQRHAEHTIGEIDRADSFRDIHSRQLQRNTEQAIGEMERKFRMKTNESQREVSDKEKSKDMREREREKYREPERDR